MDLRGKKPVFKRTKTAMERNNIFATIRRYAKKLKPQYNGDVYLETVRCYFDISQENLEKCRYTYQGNETYAFLMSDKYIMALYTHCLVTRKKAAMQGTQIEGFTEKEYGMVRLKNLLDLNDAVTVNLHIQSIDQAQAIRNIKRKMSDLQKMTIEEQESGPIRNPWTSFPPTLPPMERKPKSFCRFESRNERMFLGDGNAKRQKLFNDILPLRVWHRNTISAFKNGWITSRNRGYVLACSWYEPD